MQKIEQQSFTKNVLSLLEKSVVTVFRIWHSNPAFKKRFFKRIYLLVAVLKKEFFKKKEKQEKRLYKNDNRKLNKFLIYIKSRSSHPEAFLEKGVLRICSKLTWEDPCQSAISIKLQNNFIEVALQHGCSYVDLLHISRTLFPKNTSERLLTHLF